MLERVKYINHLNETIEFGKNGLIITDSDLLDFVWDLEKDDNQIKGFSKKITSKNLTLAIKTKTIEESITQRNRVFETFEKDVLNKSPGKFVIGKYCLKCYVTTSSKKDYVKRSNYLTVKLKINTDYPFWCHELTKSFLKGNVNAEALADAEYLYYPISYPYQYSMPSNIGFLQNDHYAPCDFRMIVYGPCTNPSILINGHLYEVQTTLYTGEYILVDSRSNKVTKHLNDGSTVNLFNYRVKDSSLFEKIPNGRCSVSWNTAAFGFDITLFQERSEPKWIL